MLSLSFHQFSFTVALVLFFTGTRLDAKRVFVDDANTRDIIYSPGWVTGNNCTGCFAQPDRRQAFNGTWHDVTSAGDADIFFTFMFIGTSVEARYIALDIIETAFTFTTGTNVSYSIDGVQRGTAVRNPANRGTYAYDQLLFNVTGLINAQHTLRVDLLKPSVLLLDSLVFDDGSAETGPTPTSTSTFSTPSNTSPTFASSGPSTDLGPIIGGVVAAVLVLVLSAILIWYFKKRRSSRQTLQKSVLPFLRPEDNASPPPKYIAFDARPMFVGSITQADQTFKHLPPASGGTDDYTSPVTGSNRTVESLTRTDLMPTTISSSLATKSHSSLPSVIKARYLHETPPVGMPRHSVQDTTKGGAPPSSFYNNVVGNLVHAQTPNEQVEEGRMSRQTSMRSTLPPYSPGVFQCDDDAPPLPG